MARLPENTTTTQELREFYTHHQVLRTVCVGEWGRGEDAFSHQVVMESSSKRAMVSI
jgi:hypothetical protein